MDTIYSPQKTYEIGFTSYEVRMSHWIDEPSIYRAQGNVLLFKMPSTWSADEVHWLDEHVVALKTRLYPGRVWCTLVLNLETGTGTAERGRYTFTAAQPEPPRRFEGTFQELINWI